MPAAQLKMLRYMRNPEPKGNGPGGVGSPRAANAQPPAPPPPQSAPPPPPPPQHAPPPLAARQPLVEAAKIPVPVSSSRYATSSQGPSTNTSIPTIPQPTRHQSAQQLHQRLEQQQHHLSPQRMRANSEDNGRSHALTDRQQQLWEESTINSMFSDGASGPARQQRPNHSRYDSPYPPPSRQIQYDRNLRNRNSEELSPFVIGDNGQLKVIPTTSLNASVALNTRAQKAEASAAEEATGHYESPSKNSGAGNNNNNPTLKHAKYPFRDGRAATKRASFTGRLSHHADPDDALVSPPERLRTVLSGIEPRDRDTDTKRSTFFHDLDTPLHRTPAPPEDNESSAPSQGDEATNQQRTPRLSRPSAGKLLAAVAKGLQESSLPRNSINTTTAQQQQRDRKTVTPPANNNHNNKKRRLSLDYDDHALHSMSYSDLKNEVFDYDPARVAIQAAAVPTGECLEDKLAYYKTKDENAQHHFFTQVSVQEWETCGDWFLEQFSLVVKEMRSRRYAKRKLVTDFEAEIADREKTVRSKVESIDRTLNQLKKEGEVMMKGRDVDL